MHIMSTNDALTDRVSEIHAIRQAFPEGCETCPAIQECLTQVDARLAVPTQSSMGLAQRFVDHAVEIRSACPTDEPETAQRFGRTTLNCASPLA